MTVKATESGTVLIPKWCSLCKLLSELGNQPIYTKLEMFRLLRAAFMEGKAQRPTEIMCIPHTNYFEAMKSK